jgi:hypothetical protein
MRKLLQFVFTVMAGVGLLLMSERQAHAYADPGSSLLILQTVGSVLTATGLYFRRRIASFFRRNKPEETETAAPETPVSPSSK